MIHDNSQYITRVGDAHRKSFGQFFTHPTIAKFMVDWVLASGEPHLYDPAFGLGAFYSPISDDAKIHFSGSEADPTIISHWQSQENRNASFISVEDYLLSWGKHHKNIVCNPPYMRFQKFLNRDKVSSCFQRHLDLRLSGYTNTASAFLLKSLSEMDGTGRLAYIMPLEFLNTGYGVFVKKRLIEDGHLAAILSINCEKEVFPDATTSVGIILYDSTINFSSVRFYSLNSIDNLTETLRSEPISEINLTELDPDSKWLPYFQESTFEIDPELTVPLDYYGRFSRGIATGANEFFVLKPSTAKSMGLNPSELLPCITKSSQINKSLFDAVDLASLVEDDAPVLLFSANGNQSGKTEAYIRYGEQHGFNQRFLTKHRKPWFKTENRSVSPLLLGVFSRGGYKIILNRSDALNLTCFHGFQPNLFGMHYVEHLFLYLTSRVGRKIVSLAMRKYGSSLDKFEPNDLNGAAVPSPDFFDQISIDQVRSVIQEIEVTGDIPEFIETLFEEVQRSIDHYSLATVYN